jgi:hypothetical protein
MLKKDDTKKVLPQSFTRSQSWTHQDVLIEENIDVF